MDSSHRPYVSKCSTGSIHIASRVLQMLDKYEMAISSAHVKI